MLSHKKNDGKDLLSTNYVPGTTFKHLTFMNSRHLHYNPTLFATRCPSQDLNLGYPNSECAPTPATLEAGHSVLSELHVVLIGWSMMGNVGARHALLVGKLLG